MRSNTALILFLTTSQPVYLDATPTAPIMMDDPPTVADDNSADTGN
jgi:hypothetical protein